MTAFTPSPPFKGPAPDFGPLYLVATPRPAQSDEDFLTRVYAALSGGVSTLQVRVKDREGLAYCRLAERVVALGRDFGVPVFVNDRADVALAAGAQGVHLGQGDLSPQVVRAFAPGLLLGRSTHAPEQASVAMQEGVAYFAVGPVFATPTKAGRAAVGLEYVRWAAQNAQGPWFAIGGIDLTTLPQVVAAGATRVAAVRAILDAPDPAVAARQFLEVLSAS